MTGEIAILALGAFLIGVALFWKAFRLLDERLGKIQDEIGDLHNAASHLFTLTSESDAKAFKAEPNFAPAQRAYKHQADALLRSPGLKDELDEVDALCAKLITLVPPEEAMPLLKEGTAGKPAKFEGRKLLLAWPPQDPPEQRMVPRKPDKRGWPIERVFSGTDPSAAGPRSRD